MVNPIGFTSVLEGLTPGAGWGGSSPLSHPPGNKTVREMLFVSNEVVVSGRVCPRSLNEVTEIVKREMYEVASHFVYIGYCLWSVKQFNYYRSGGYADVYDYASQELGFKRTTTKNLIGISATFGNRYYHSFSSSILPTADLQPVYQDFNYSQLTEMLSMSEKQRAQVTPDMSVRQIRELKKGSAPASEPEFPLEPQYETIPMDLPEPDPAPVSVGQTSDQEDLVSFSLDIDDVQYIVSLLKTERTYLIPSDPEYSQVDRILNMFSDCGF